MGWLLLDIVLAVAAAGALLMLAAFALAARTGWERAMGPGAGGRWPWPRRLLLAGVTLLLLFGLSLFVPGVIPYRDDSTGMAWVMGIVFGLSVSAFYHRLVRAAPPTDGRRPRQDREGPPISGSDSGPRE